MESFRLDPARITFVIKRTKWERDLLRYGSSATACKIYKKQKKPLERIMQSHKRQISNIGLLKDSFSKAKFIYHEELPFIDAGTFDLMVSVGGDNHFVHISHYCGDNPVLGLNSDSKTSTGALLGFSPKEAIEAINYIINNDYWDQKFEIETWSRIQGQAVYPDGKHINIPPCTSEISLRSKFHDYISRYLICKKGMAFEEHKCTGLLLATGAGSTGWFRNCHDSGMQEDVVFPKDSDFFRSIARETNTESILSNQFIATQVNKNETLEIISAMDGEITIDADPNRVYAFPPGCVASFVLSEKKLRVIQKK